jgi:hypothetical protein
VIRKLGADGQGAPFSSQVGGYLEIIQQLGSAQIKDLLAWERNAVMRHLGLPQSAIPQFKIASLAGENIENSLMILDERRMDLYDY